MGLHVNKITPHGVQVTYARFRRVSVDADAGRVDGLLAYYVNKGVRLDGGQPVWYEEISFAIDQLPEDFRASAYKYITEKNPEQVGLAS